MFGRLKQKVREATGRAMATQLPEDVAGKIAYVEAWESRDRQLVKALDAMTEGWKKNKHRAEMSQAAEEIGGECDGDLKTGADNLAAFLRMRIGKEKRAHDGTQVFDKAMQTFFHADLRALMESVKNVKKRRLTRDGAESDLHAKQNDDRQRKFDAAEADFQLTLRELREKLLRLTELDQLHADALFQTVAVFVDAFDDGK